MLFEKNTLFGLLVPWLTGCKLVSPGHLPFCARASISVPGAPASSLATGSQLLVLNPGVDICAPDWVATALLCTVQPAAPRSVTSELPGLAGELRIGPAGLLSVVPWCWAGNPWPARACAAEIEKSWVAATRRAAVDSARNGRTGRIMACSRRSQNAANRSSSIKFDLVCILSKPMCQWPHRLGGTQASELRRHGQRDGRPASCTHRRGQRAPLDRRRAPGRNRQVRHGACQARLR